MANPLLLLALAAVCLLASADQKSGRVDRLSNLNDQCCGPKVETWSHQPKAKLPDSSVSLSCLGDGEIFINVTSPATLTLFSMYFVQRTANGAFMETELINDRRTVAPAVAAAMAAAIDPEYHEEVDAVVQPQFTIPPSLEIIPVEFDYADLPQTKPLWGKESARAVVDASPVSHTFHIKPADHATYVQTATDIQCDDPDTSDVQFTFTLKGDGYIKVVEHFFIDGIIELLTETHIFPSCHTFAKQPESEVLVALTTDGPPFPVCQRASYQVAGGTVANTLLVNVASLTHPTNDAHVSWRIKELNYAADQLIKDSSTATTAFASICAELKPDNGDLGSGNQYQVTSAIVGDGSDPSVDVSVQLEFCLNRPNLPDVVSVCGASTSLDC